jgi:hypothetical protein
LVGVVQAGGAFQRNPLLALGGVCKTVGVHAPGKLTVAGRQQVEVQIEARLQVK